MNKKAVQAKRYYASDKGEFNKGSQNFGDGAFWKKIEAENPPAVSETATQSHYQKQLKAAAGTSL